MLTSKAASPMSVRTILSCKLQYDGMFINGSLEATQQQLCCVIQAQYNAPFEGLGEPPFPANRVNVACSFLEDSSLEGSDLLAAMAQATGVFTGYNSSAGGCFPSGASTGAGSQPNALAEPPAVSEAAPPLLAFPESAPGLASTGPTTNDRVFTLSEGVKFGGYQVRNHSIECANCQC